ncbi:MAG: thiamine-phosphate kinase [Chitinophagales bacterium]|nr:thiamine-phosphate kinase [Chitinophagales bacterium]
MSAEQRTEISELGEFGLIRRLTEPFTVQHPSTVLAVGDDAAVIQYEAGRHTVITTDLLLEGIHFDLMYVPLKHLGYKAVVVNLSDVYAMNAVPRQITVSIGVSNRFSVEALEELYEGIRAACKKYQVDLIGGDTSSSVKGMVISVTAIGETDANRLVRRSGASVNELICVTGDLGAAYLGLQLLEREKRLFLENPKLKPDLEGQAYVVGRQLKPEARRDVIAWLQQAGILPTSMIDVSDGLSSDVLHLCQASGTGCKLYEEKIPVSDDAYALALKFHLDPITCALSGGEDYELLFTIRQQDYEKIQNHPDISVIGHMQEAAAGSVLITKSGKEHPLTALGWNAFPKA